MNETWQKIRVEMLDALDEQNEFVREEQFAGNQTKEMMHKAIGAGIGIAYDIMTKNIGEKKDINNGRTD